MFAAVANWVPSNNNCNSPATEFAHEINKISVATWATLRKFPWAQTNSYWARAKFYLCSMKRINDTSNVG